MKITDFEILYAEPSDDGKSFSARLGIDTLRQEMWLLDQVGVSENPDKDIKYPIEARVVLSCDRKCRLYVQNANHASVGECRLSADETQRFADYLVDYAGQVGTSVPRWLNETALPPLYAPSLKLSDIRPTTFDLQEMQFECELHPDIMLTQTLTSRCDISSDGLVMNSATLYAQVNADLTIDASVRFSGSINGVYGGVTTVDFELTEKERNDILKDAGQHKQHILEQIENNWRYLSAPLGYERDEQEREIPPATDKPAPEKKPSREHGGMER